MHWFVWERGSTGVPSIGRSTFSTWNMKQKQEPVYFACIARNLIRRGCNWSRSSSSAETNVSKSRVSYGWLRRSGLSLDTQPALNTSWGYHAAGRLETVSQGGATVAYQYVANSLLVGHIAFTLNAQPRMSTSKEYQRGSRLVGIRSVPQGPGADGQAQGAHCGYNAAGQCIRPALPDGSYWLYTYDRLGQVISGKKYWPDQVPVARPVRYCERIHVGLRPPQSERSSILRGIDGRLAAAVSRVSIRTVLGDAGSRPL